MAVGWSPSPSASLRRAFLQPRRRPSTLTNSVTQRSAPWARQRRRKTASVTSSIGASTTGRREKYSRSWAAEKGTAARLKHGGRAGASHLASPSRAGTRVALAVQPGAKDRDPEAIVG